LRYFKIVRGINALKKLAILFQEPFVPRKVTYGKFSRGAGNNTFPYGLASIARYIFERGYRVHYLDPIIENMAESEYVRFLESNRFDLIGMSSTTLQVNYTIKSFELIKRYFPGIITVLGGIHGTLMPEGTLQMRSGGSITTPSGRTVRWST
jgi:radical SAM superfamily enzyme YgiQ (UPF0313 family)